MNMAHTVQSRMGWYKYIRLNMGKNGVLGSNKSSYTQIGANNDLPNFSFCNFFMWIDQIWLGHWYATWYICFVIYLISLRSVRWYYGFSIASVSAVSTTSASSRRPRRREHSNSKNIQPIFFKFYMRVDTPQRYFAIEIWYPPVTRTAAFTAKWHSYPPNLQNAISP